MLVPAIVVTTVAVSAVSAYALLVSRSRQIAPVPARPVAAAQPTQTAEATSSTVGSAATVISAPATVSTPATVAPKPKPKPKPAQPAPFDVARAMAHVRQLSVGIGQRVGGSASEDRAIAYARDYLASLGYQVSVVPVPLANGRTSHNVIAKRRRATGPIVVIGGHIDTKSPAPGADDNATGVGATLELARDFAKAPTATDVRFVAFGCEELLGDGNSDHHHYGSRAYVRSLSASERKRFAGAVVIDMVGYGPDFRVRNMGVGTRVLCDRMLGTAHVTKAPLEYLRDPGSSGWSDHEAFERAGLPAAWLEWRDNPNAHTARDSFGRVDAGKIRTTGVLVNTWLRSLTAADLAKLVATR